MDLDAHGCWPGHRMFKCLVLAGAGTKRTRVVLPTPQGTIRANWIRTDKKKIKVNLSLPHLVKADVILPGLVQQTVSGEKTWEVEA